MQVVGSSHVFKANLFLKTGLDVTSNPDSLKTMVGRTSEFGMYLDLVEIVILSIFPKSREVDIIAWNFPLVPPKPLSGPPPC